MITPEIKEYKRVLRKIFLIENLGEHIYYALLGKADDDVQRTIYRRLALNEAKTAHLTEEELARLYCPVPVIRKRFIGSIAYIVCSVLSQSTLEKLLKKTLRRRMFSSWFNIYHKFNENFWEALLSHENLQHELLKL